MKRSRKTALIVSLAVTGLFGQTASDQAGKIPGAAELAQLKAQLAEQQKQIEQLTQTLAAQGKLLEKVSSTPAGASDASAAAAPAPATPATPAVPAVQMLPNLGEVASTTPALPPAPPPPAPRVLDPQVPAGDQSSPLQLQLGNITIMPVGFMDLTAVWRNENAGSGIGSNFGSVPYANATTAHLSEFRFSPQNSRIGFRIDGNWKGAHFIGYNEFDFLGKSADNGIGVTNGAFVPRIRLYWVDVRKGGFEFLAGQSWSMLTPNRKGLSPLPGDIFYSQVMDVNYMIGLPWTRQPGVRFIYHPSDKVAVGLALENPNQYAGGNAGSGAIVPPTALATLVGAQLDNTSGGYLSTPNLTPDFIAKIAFDPTARVHFEIAGIERNFKVWNPTNNKTFTTEGAGGSVNGNFQVAKGFNLITNNYWSDGGGRYIFGQAPDVVLRSDGSISPIHAGGTVDGIEFTISPKFMLFSYYGGLLVDKNVALDTNGSPVGYGYRGSANSQNRVIQEFTIGYVHTLWKDPKYGALSMIAQYEWLMRDPWFVAANTPKNAHDNTVYFDVRYTLPGAAPAMK